METVATKVTSPVVQSLQMQQAFYAKALAGIKDEDASKRIDQGNHISWLAGHIVSCRYMLLGMLGVQEQEPYPLHYAGLKRITKEAYPTLDDLQQDMPAISEKLTHRLLAMSEEELNADFHGGKLLDVVLFFVYHEAYHIGQIGMLRKHWGYPALNHQG